MSNNKETSEKSKKKKTSSIMRIFKLAIIFSIILTVAVAGAGLGFLTASFKTVPVLNSDMQPAASSQIFDVNGTLLTTIHSEENRLPVSINKIPKNLQNAFIATEDIRFYQHSGVDIRSILRAVWINLTNRGISEGASTITQQLARNAFLSQDQTLTRKIHEAILAVQIERKYSKTEILEMYLNQIYFGHGAYGVQAAADGYFGKNVEDLNLGECAFLAGIPKSPNYYAGNFKAAQERQRVVLDQMVKYGFLDRMTATRTGLEDLTLITRSTDTVGAYFIDYVIQTMIDKMGKGDARAGADAVYRGGLKIYTTLDLNMQTAAEKAMSQLPVSRTENKIRQPQGALVAIDPHTGHIKAMVGGRGDDQFNRAVLAERQPGSAFKPFVFLAALESGLTPATMVDDSPVTYSGWTPKNYSGTFSNAPVSLRTALELSLNSVAVKLAKQIGVDKTLYYAQQMGISTLVLNGSVNDRNLAMSLGGLSRGVTPLEIASAYGVLANQGVRVEPTAIVKVVGRDGKVLEEHVPKGKVVINESSAYLLTDMMKGVISRGTGTGANIGRPAAGKTGTTSDYKDAWFIGFTPDLVTAVWMGHDNNYSLSGVTGGTIPATIWRSFMNSVSERYVARDFGKPSGIVTVQVSNKDGLLVNNTDKDGKDGKDDKDKKETDSRTELFVEGTQPTKVSPSAVPTSGKSKDDETNKSANDDKNTKNGSNDSKNANDLGNSQNTTTPTGGVSETTLPPPPKSDSPQSPPVAPQPTVPPPAPPASTSSQSNKEQ